jgi:hypothetical protein
MKSTCSNDDNGEGAEHCQPYECGSSFAFCSEKGGPGERGRAESIVGVLFLRITDQLEGHYRHTGQRCWWLDGVMAVQVVNGVTFSSYLYAAPFCSGC